MITLHHNFDETKFKWLWAKYVKAGNIEKHCTASMIGVYSKKFSGTSNHNLLSQPILTMDEIAPGSYEAIYFCGVLKKGYLHKDPTKNNYRHNVHFAIRPQEGARDVWDFENWHVEVEGGVFERIPETYELKDKFFEEPYTSHYYTCRIFRWMVGHFYPQELRDCRFNYPETILSEDDKPIETVSFIKDLILSGKKYVEIFFEDETGWGYFADAQSKSQILKEGLVDRKEIGEYIFENMGGGCGPLIMEIYNDYIDDYETGKFGITEKEFLKFMNIGIEEGLDMYFPYQERRIIDCKYCTI